VYNGKIRVFLIEDNPGDARLIQDLLTEAGDSLFYLGHDDRLSTGLKRLRQGDIDVILLDLSLPDSQGLDSLSKVIAEAPRVPIVVMSGLEDELVAIKAVQEGAQDYLVKGSVEGKLLGRSLRYAMERQHLQVALREGELHYRLLADNAADVIWTANMKWQITNVSPSIKRLLGYTVEEMKRLSIRDILTPDSLKQASKLIRNQMDIMTAELQYPPLSLMLEHVRKEGSTLWAEVMLSFLWDKEGRLSEILGVTRDITARKKAEEALRESQEQYAALVSNVADGVFRFKQGKITWCNDKLAKMRGCPKEELIGADIDKLVPSDVRIPDLYRTIGAGLKKQGHFQGIMRTKKKDGSVVDLEYSASPIPGTAPIELVGIVRDITERKRAEEELKIAEAKYRGLVETAGAAVATINPKGEFIFVNEAGCKMTGYSREEIIGRPFTDLLHPDDRGIVQELFLKSLEGSRTPVLEFRIAHKDGHVVWCFSIPTTITYEGKIIGFSAIMQDITERRVMQEQLLLTGRLAAVGELSAGVAHELNNPLAAIQMYSEFLSKRNDLDEVTKKDLRAIYEQAVRASKITSDLLSFARKHKPERTLISINGALEKTLELRAHQMKVNNIELLVQLQPDLPTTNADFYQMQQVFMNIVVNAEQAMLEAHGGGKLIVCTQRSDDFLRVTFTDNGAGMSEETLKRIFDPFFTTKNVGKGTGLGLSICYGIVQAHKGRIYAESKLGKGTTFVVEIPITTKDRSVANS
jgi:two-component system NtrC family sensor kinase